MSVSAGAASRIVTTRASEGFTLTELMVVMVIFGIITAVALPGFNKFMRSLDLNSEIQRAATSMRVVRQRAITENNNYVVWYDTGVNGFGWWDDDNNNGIKEGPEASHDPEGLPNWITVANSGSNPFPSDSLTFLPNGSASASGSRIFSNSDGYTRSLSVVRPTGMVTVQ
jgi:prepilin-type N-terminal cleavage/methylation domain-containing protein